MSPLQNSSLSGWLSLVPSIMVYIGFVVPFAVYIVMFSRVLQRQPILPTQAHKNIVRYVRFVVCVVSWLGLAQLGGDWGCLSGRLVG